MPLQKRLVAEFLGTFFLVAAVIGSGIMADRLSAGNVRYCSPGKYYSRRFLPPSNVPHEDICTLCSSFAG
jgi:hypothetical protein